MPVGSGESGESRVLIPLRGNVPGQRLQPPVERGEVVDAQCFHQDELAGVRESKPQVASTLERSDQVRDAFAFSTGNKRAKRELPNLRHEFE